MKTILNLTQHNATPEQLDAGVIDLSPALKERLVDLLTFVDLPSRRQVAQAAVDIAALAQEQGATAVMIGGAPFLMPALSSVLQQADIQPLYAFSVRESVEETQPDGSVRKTNVFRHRGFVEAP